MKHEFIPNAMCTHGMWSIKFRIVVLNLREYSLFSDPFSLPRRSNVNVMPFELEMYLLYSDEGMYVVCLCTMYAYNIHIEYAYSIFIREHTYGIYIAIYTFAHTLIITNIYLCKCCWYPFIRFFFSFFEFSSNQNTDCIWVSICFRASKLLCTTKYLNGSSSYTHFKCAKTFRKHLHKTESEFR